VGSLPASLFKKTFTAKIAEKSREVRRERQVHLSRHAWAPAHVLDSSHSFCEIARKHSSVVLPEKFLNRTWIPAVFMSEGRQVAAGEAILSIAASIERSRSENDNDALEAMVREHSRLVYRIAYSVLRSHHDAEDATQETFMRVLRYSSKLAAVEDSKPWLARIAWRVAVDRSRRRGRAREIPMDDPESSFEEVASAGDSADETMQGAEVSIAVEKMIAALPEKLREPLILSTIEEMSPREVAATLGINEAAVRSRVFRARQILKEKLAARISRVR
jgi:RNA polymerase sigma-70 factor, ECF subfamily